MKRTNVKISFELKVPRQGPSYFMNSWFLIVLIVFFQKVLVDVLSPLFVRVLLYELSSFNKPSQNWVFQQTNSSRKYRLLWERSFTLAVTSSLGSHNISNFKIDLMSTCQSLLRFWAIFSPQLNILKLFEEGRYNLILASAKENMFSSVYAR